MMNIDLSSLPGFAAPSIERCDEIRTDREALAAAFVDPRGRRLLLDGLDPVRDGAVLAREPIPAGADVHGHVLLGREADGAPLFVELCTGLPHGAVFAPSLRQAANELDARELALYGGARSLVDWHARHGFCAVCGGATAAIKGGWARRCDGCGAEHFPRVDPVVIMLAEHEGRVLVGRQARFPPGSYSALAGFVEPGETIEGAVARELHEEAGIRVHDVRYVASQPWPFPSSLMIACLARAEDDRLTIDRTELEDAFWVDMQGVREALDGVKDALFIAPPAMAIAHHLLRYWLAQRD